MLINLLSRTKYPNEPEHMPLAETVFLSGGAALVCAAVSVLIAYWMTSEDYLGRARGIFVWLLAGFAFGILSPVATGISIPTSGVLLDLYRGVTPAGETPMLLLDSAMRWPRFAFTQGVFGLFTGMLAGILFSAGGWIIDNLNHLPNRNAAIAVISAVTLALSVLFYAIAAFGPPDALARLG